MSSVEHHGEALLLVEDTWMTDSESPAPESRRTWVATSGAETRTITSALASDTAHTLAGAVTDALVGAALERALSEGASKDAMAAAVRKARTAEVRAESAALVIDGEPQAGLAVAWDGTVISGVVVGETIVLVVSDARGVALTLKPVA
ncbi:hypothetical protein [Sanguibacter sp. 25GB23B1]|uniref:hypothetical protein n=1 Tax=unclassified Sanguibacter TaxID=2645534 RepID=UPI0032AEBE3B